MSEGQREIKLLKSSKRGDWVDSSTDETDFPRQLFGMSFDRLNFLLFQEN